MEALLTITKNQTFTIVITLIPYKHTLTTICNHSAKTFTMSTKLHFGIYLCEKDE